MLVTSTCETMPIAGRMAMYTSGCPKNQNMCCQSSGEPPACGWSLSPTTSPAGMKKLVPAFLSRISSKQAGRSTAKAINPMHEVINHAQVEEGMRIKVMPFVRRSNVVAMKFNEPSNCPMQNTAMEMAQRFCPQPRPGPASLPTALRGAYAVQPEIGGPSGMMNAVIRIRKATKVVQNDIMLNRGKA